MNCDGTTFTFTYPKKSLNLHLSDEISETETHLKNGIRGIPSILVKQILMAESSIDKDIPIVAF